MYIDVSMLDCQIAILENAIARYLAKSEIPEPMGSRHPSIAPFEAFKTKDSHIIIAAGNDKLFEKLCKVLNLENLHLIDLCLLVELLQSTKQLTLVSISHH